MHIKVVLSSGYTDKQKKFYPFVFLTPFVSKIMTPGASTQKATNLKSPIRLSAATSPERVLVMELAVYTNRALFGANIRDSELLEAATFRDNDG